MPAFRLHLALALFGAGLVLVADGARAQAYSVPGVTTPQGGEEKKPTNRDPSYLPPLLPEYLRRRLNPNAGLLLSTGGEFDLESFVQAQALQKANRKKPFDRYESRDYSDTADSLEDRSRFEADVLRQFGVNVPQQSPLGHQEYQESAGRRFQIVFLLSLPITTAFSYGVVTAAKGTFGRTSGLNNGETIAVGVGGLLASGIIAWRDLGLWRAAEHERLRKRDIPAPSAAPGPSGKSPASAPQGLRSLELPNDWGGPSTAAAGGANPARGNRDAYRQVWQFAYTVSF